MPSPAFTFAALLLGQVAPTGGVAPTLKRDAGVVRPSDRIQEAQPIRVSFDEEPAPFPPEIAEEVKRIEGEHRAAVSRPVESWNLEPIRQRYEFLLKGVNSPAVASALRGRLVLVVRHEEIARSARAFASILEVSRRRDRQIAANRRRFADLEKPQRRPYIAEGLIQASSRQIDGHRVFALIGPEGRPIAYLDIPPGLDARPVLSKRVGVRGTIHFDENFGAQLIAVRDIDALE